MFLLLDRSGTFDSVLGVSLLTEWAWGKLSAPDVQKYAAKALQDQQELLVRIGQGVDLCSNTLKALSSIGRNGLFPGNAHRELVTWLGEPSTPKCFEVAINVVNQKAQKPKSGAPFWSRAHSTLHVVPAPVNFFLPHVMFNHYFSKFPARFFDSFLGESCSAEFAGAALKKFWGEVVKRKDLSEPPIRPGRFWKRFGFGPDGPKTGKKTYWKRFRLFALETHWKRIGNALETHWKRIGNALETLAGTTETHWKR